MRGKSKLDAGSSINSCTDDSPIPAEEQRRPSSPFFPPLVGRIAPTELGLTSW